MSSKMIMHCLKTLWNEYGGNFQVNRTEDLLVVVDELNTNTWKEIDKDNEYEWQNWFGALI